MTARCIRLLHVASAVVGGIGRHVADLLAHLPQSQYELALAYSPSRTDEGFMRRLPALARAGVRLIQIPLDREIHLGHDLRGQLALLRVVRRLQPDAIHAHGAKAAALVRVAALLTGRGRVVYTTHGGAFHQFARRHGSAYLAVERALSLQGNHFIGVSQHAAEQVTTSLGVARSRVHVVYNGIDAAATAAPTEFPSASPLAPALDGRFVALVPALFYETKGHLELLEALGSGPERLHPDVAIAFLGEGPLRSRIERRIVDLGLAGTVSLLGYHADPAPYYRRAAVVLVPSQDEALGYAILEAMAFSRPVVATAVGGIPEIVVHGTTGELFARNAVRQVVGILNHLLRDRQTLAAYGRAGCARVRSHFGMQQMIDGTVNVYERVLSR